jgi:hypothetical protein
MVSQQADSAASAVRPARLNRRRLLVALVCLTVGWALVLASVAAGVVLTRTGNRFSIVDWEITRLGDELVKHAVTRPLRGAASTAEVSRYFELQSQAGRLRSRLAAGTDPAASGQLAAVERQISPLKLRVELRFEDAVAAAARREGLVERLPLFGGVSLVWPPVAASFDQPPHILIVSPRNRISLDDTTLLRTDLSDAEAIALERETERKPNTSALVDQIGGLGAYPSIVDESGDPLYVIQDTAHEWMHNYLVFHPLGARYGLSGDLTLINETVANIAGRELGTSAYLSLGLGLPQDTSPRLR